MAPGVAAAAALPHHVHGKSPGGHAMSTAVKLKPNMTDAEWSTRCELAALYHVLNHLGWTDTINTHMSARIPDEPDHFLINNYGEMFDEITASSLVKMDMDGNVMSPGGKFNMAGLVIHSGVYKARADANCVLHTHTRAGAGVSLLRNGLRPISQDHLHVMDEVVYHEYGVPASQEECEALGKSCANGTCVVLMNHGLLTLGETIPGTFQRLYMLERACELELIARQLDEPPVIVDEYVQRKAAERMKKQRAMPTYGQPEFQGLVRTVERKGFNWRQ
jgi:ribulose-5-phosphate 4-epimerase/fuculose-1-phosphate aldolase